jgi:hypothetical protein
MTRRHWFFIAIFLGVAFLLAFPLQKIVHDIAIKPLLYIIWVLKIAYHAIPQFWTWAILLFVTILIMAIPLFDISASLPRRKKRVRKPLGPIATLSETIEKSSSGTYFKWVLANRMGRIMRDWLAYREHVVKRWQANYIAKLGWSSSKSIQKYLDVGINGSFADYPSPRLAFLRRRRATPLDIDPHDVLDYLESHMEVEIGH